MKIEELKVLCDLTGRLTEAKLKNVPNLCIENYAPALLAKLIDACGTSETVTLAPVDIKAILGRPDMNKESK